MRTLLRLALAACLVPLPALAQTQGTEPAAPAPTPPSAAPALPAPPAPTASVPALPADHAGRLDALFARLKKESDPARAEGIANQIQAEWLQSGSATIDLLMQRATQAVAAKNTASALDLLDQAIVLRPDFPEAWNRRATVHYADDRYTLAITDVEETLKREPRHFASLMGLAAMQEEVGRSRDALSTYLRVLAVYPALKDAQDAALKLSDALAGDRA
ncbi:tetratricopeptide repeat protein [Aureimonas sp. AU40]|uniref:tetratricopeptide repeat protein n=1 Tax=Aureimonas sp. AU40 TaxID=1637747 RepID=UPI0007805CE7|nr:tetratricopeptide repeat protein [Aureimonas sp. AU40]